MSTQDEHGIDFSILPEESLQHFRLLELPTEILQLLTSEDPPTLQLKSIESEVGNNNVVLCTPNQTFDLRQVSTSNSVFVAQSTHSSHDLDTFPQPRLQAVAQPQSTLEVIISTQTSAVPYIAARVPVYTSTGHYSQKVKIHRQELFASVPLSDAECESAWKKLACFELGDDRHCVLPSASVKLKAWQTMLRTATAAGIDLTEHSARSITDQLFISDDDDLPHTLLDAVFRSMCIGQSLILDADGCAEVTGKALLKDLTDAARGPVPIADFVTKWEDLLPEQWRDLAVLSSVAGSHSIGGNGQEILFEDETLMDAATANGSANSDAKSTLGAKRKWHEKFRAAKKTA